MVAASDSREFPAELARAGQARHFISWRAAVAGLGRGRLTDLATAAEAALTDILLSTGEGTLRIRCEHDGETFRACISHPRIERRSMADLEGILNHFLDGHEVSPTRTLLVKRLHG